MFRNFVVLVTILCLNVSCARRRPIPGTAQPAPKNPPSVKVDPVDGGIVKTAKRTLVANIANESNFEAALLDAGISTADVCFQYVQISSDGVAAATDYFEISSEKCPANLPVDDAKVRLRREVERGTQANEYYIKHEAGSYNLGLFQLNSGKQNEYEMLGLCELDPNSRDIDVYFQLNCYLNIDGSLFGDPAIWSN